MESREKEVTEMRFEIEKEVDEEGGIVHDGFT